MFFSIAEFIQLDAALSMVTIWIMTYRSPRRSSCRRKRPRRSSNRPGFSGPCNPTCVVEPVEMFVFAKMKGLKNQIKKIEHDRIDLQMGWRLRSADDKNDKTTRTASEDRLMHFISMPFHTLSEVYSDVSSFHPCFRKMSLAESKSSPEFCCLSIASPWFYESPIFVWNIRKLYNIIVILAPRKSVSTRLPLSMSLSGPQAGPLQNCWPGIHYKVKAVSTPQKVEVRSRIGKTWTIMDHIINVIIYIII